MNSSLRVAVCLAALICASFAGPAPASKDIRADFHAKGDCVTSDTAAFQAAAAAGGTITISIPPVCYRLTGTVTIARAARWIGAGAKAIVRPDLAPDAGTLFAVNTNDFTAENFAVTGTGLGTAPSAINHYLFIVGTDGGHYRHLTFRRISVTDWNFTDGNSGLANHIASHVFYIQNARDVKILENTARHIEGSCAFVQASAVVAIQHNNFFGCRWYPINFYAGVTDFDIGWNRIGGSDSIATFWGGAINIMSEPPVAPTANGAIHDNDLEGSYGYGSVMHISSASNITITANKIVNYKVAAVVTDPTTLSAIAIETRGVFAARLKMPGGIASNYLGPVRIDPVVALRPGTTYPVQIGDEWAEALGSPDGNLRLVRRGIAGSTPAAHADGTGIANQNGPVWAITVTGNQIDAPNIAIPRMQGIYLANLFQSGTNPARRIAISNNRFLASGSVAFTNAILINGGLGGVDGISLSGNEIVSRTSPEAIAMGAVATTANGLSGMVRALTASNNKLHDLGDGAHVTQAGFGFQFATAPKLGPNTIDGYHYGVAAYASARVALSDIDGQFIRNLGRGGKPYYIEPHP